MTGRQSLVRRHRFATLAVVVATLLARLLIPTGYMPMIEKGRLVIALCAEQNPDMAAMQAMPEMSPGQGAAAAVGHAHDHGASDHDKSGACGFGGLSWASLATIDPLLLALAILFIVATVHRRPHAPRVAVQRFLWPPRTGPPIAA